MFNVYKITAIEMMLYMMWWELWAAGEYEDCLAQDIVEGRR